MATNTKKITEELVAPTIPVTNNDAVKTAANGLQTAKNAVDNMTYDNFKGGDLYAGLRRDYQQQGQQAMKDTLGQVAARTGGMASSYATSAANQSYNNYMKTLEDAARSMYNDEYSRARDRYSMAQQEYANAYGEYRDSVGDAWNKYNAEYDAYRDSVADQRYDTEWQHKTDEAAKAADEERIYTDIYYGGTPDYNAYTEAGGKLSQAEYESIVRSAQGARSDDTYSRDQAAKEQAQEEVMAIWASGGTPTQDQLKKAGWADETASKDGTPSLNATGNAYKLQATELNTKQMQEDNYDDIYARIANGESLEEIAGVYSVDGKMDWNGLTGMSEAEWQKIYNDNTISGYTYQNTEQGRTGILNALANSANATLSAADQANFAYLYGDGTYDALQSYIGDLDNALSYALLDYANSGDEKGQGRDEETFKRYLDAWENDVLSVIPGITEEQLTSIIRNVAPAWEDIIGDPSSAAAYIGRSYFNGNWVTPAG